MKNTFNLEKLKFPIGQFQKPETISQNDLDSWINNIESFPSRIKNLTENLSVKELNWIYRPQGWNIKQVVHHCADSHMNSLIRFKLALTEDIPTIKPYEEQLWAELADGNSDDIYPSLQLIEGLHKRWVVLLKSFSEEELKRQFIHPANNKISSLAETIGTYAWHCNHHLAHIEQALANKGQF
ncbi:MAG: putative metal-dependent hydrolase [Bacteroidota bacterium]